MTTDIARAIVDEYGESEDAGPEDYDEAADAFRRVFGRSPVTDDGDQGELWSHVCAAASADGGEARGWSGRRDVTP